MEQLNRIELRGNVGSVTLREISGKLMARITLATNYAYKDKTGAAVIDTTWHNIVAWQSRDIKNLEKIERGTKLHVIGRLRNQKYIGQDEQERTSTDVVASTLSIIEGSEQLQCEF